MVEVTDRALLALQGPAAEAALARIAPGVAEMRFMDVAVMPSEFGELWVSRSGYTGEDGFEVSVSETTARSLAEALLAMEAVEPIGLGARDSLRLEAGLCLYGSDIDTTTSPVEAALEWAVQKVRRTGGARAGGFPGAARILREFDQGQRGAVSGCCPRAVRRCAPGPSCSPRPKRGAPIGTVTSGAFGPSIERPMSMAYVAASHSRRWHDPLR